MANKAKKRVISDLNGGEESGNANFSQGTKKIFKKAKGNLNSPQTKAKGPLPTKPQNGNAADGSKKFKKPKPQVSKPGFQVSKAESDKKDVTPKPEKVVDESVAMSKRLKKLEANRLKREKRKLARKEHGQHPIESTMSPEHMRQKIEEIRSRGELTKTGKRKLRILKKKLAIAEGTVLPSPQKVKTEGTATLTKNQKKKLRKAKNLAEKNARDECSTEIPDRKPVKKEPISGKVKGETKTGVANKKGKLGSKSVELTSKKPKIEKKLEKPIQKVKVPVKSEEEDYESEDESLGEEETPTSLLIKGGAPVGTESDDSEEADEDEGDGENDGDDDVEDENEEEDNDEEEDDDDEEEEVVKDVAPKKLPAVKVKKEPKLNQNIPTPTKENGEKKKRYVLFVGNVPFKATTEEIKQHFLQKVSEVTSVRIPTHPGTNKPRGFCYVEVSNNVDYEKGLSLHQTSLHGFKLNVEYTQTGSKNIKNKHEVVAKNKKLHAIRKQGKLAGSQRENHKRTFRRNFNKIQQPRKV